MLSNITLGQYFPGDSFLHRLDPRSKILLVMAVISLVFLTTDFSSYGVLFFFTAAVVAVARLHPGQLIRSIKPLWPILIITFMVHMFSIVLPEKHTVLYQWGSIFITKEGLNQGFLMAARLIFLILLSSILTMTTSPLELTDAIEILLKPFKKIGLPAHELAMMMTIALRFIPTLLNETERIMKAQSARGMDFASGNILKRGKNLLPILIPLFLSAFRRAEELAVAMEARCYRGGDGRTRMNQLKFGSGDAVALLAVSLLAAAMYAVKGSL